MRFFPEKKLQHALVLTLSVVLFVPIVIGISSCENKNANMLQRFPNADSIPLLNTTDVSTMISDSGVVRYHITAKQWLIFDKSKEIFWTFPAGIHVECFDRQHRTTANIRSDKAFYSDRAKLWTFSGKVQAINVNDERFETEVIYWSQREERIYSDQFISITQSDKIITGIGFESNQTLTRYTIHQPQGIFPIEEDSTSVEN